MLTSNLLIFYQTLLALFSTTFIFILIIDTIHWFRTLLQYFFISYLLTSFWTYSLFIFTFPLYTSLFVTNIECSSFISLIQMLLIYLIHYFFRYLYLLSWYTFCLFHSLIEGSVNFSASTQLRVENIFKRYFILVI